MGAQHIALHVLRCVGCCGVVPVVTWCHPCISKLSSADRHRSHPLARSLATCIIYLDESKHSSGHVPAQMLEFGLNSFDSLQNDKQCNTVACMEPVETIIGECMAPTGLDKRTHPELTPLGVNSARSYAMWGGRRHLRNGRGKALRVDPIDKRSMNRQWHWLRTLCSLRIVFYYAND